jgi:hypothetical protein
MTSPNVDLTQPDKLLSCEADTATATDCILSLDRARTFIPLLVLLHHSVVNYTYFGRGDKVHWLGFDLVVLFNDSFFMACMLLISGLFVHQGLKRWGPANFLANRALRLGAPFLLSIFVLKPIAITRRSFAITCPTRPTSTSMISGGIP